jgi:hemerythrin-like metal-binding protein
MITSQRESLARPKQIGHVQIDKDHIVLWGLMREVQRQIEGAPGSSDAKVEFARLVKETEQQFHREEDMMKRLGYPLFAKHRHSHHLLRAYIDRIKHRFTHGEIAAPSLVSDLWKSIAIHIETQDQDFADFLSATNGICP